MRGYTTIGQAKKLLELGLSADTADMMYRYDFNEHCHRDIPMIPEVTTYDDAYCKDLPCWSLAALLELMPASIQTKESVKPYTLMVFKRAQLVNEGGLYEVEYGCRCPITVGWLNEWYEVKGHKDLLTASYKMVCWLLENGYVKKGE